MKKEIIKELEKEMNQLLSLYENEEENIEQIFKIASVFINRFDEISDMDNDNDNAIRLSECRRLMKEVIWKCIPNREYKHRFKDQIISDIVDYCNIRCFVEECHIADNRNITKKKMDFIKYDHYCKKGKEGGPAIAYILEDDVTLYKHLWDNGDWVFVVE